jgi:hypothetical protein
MGRELELLRAADYADGAAGGQAVAQCLSGRWLLMRALWRAAVWRLTGREGHQFNLPHMFTLFQEVGFLRHYSAMRALFHGDFRDGAGGGGGEPVSYDPTRHEPAHSPHGSPRGGRSPRAQKGGGEESDSDSEAEPVSDPRPALLYVRPDVGEVQILDYGRCEVIEAKGAVAAERAMKKWSAPRWNAPGNTFPL